MATKTIKFKGGQLIDTTEEVVGWVADDSSGLQFVADPATGDAQSAYSVLTHMVTETNNPLWNQVRVNQSYRNTTASSLFDGHVTLQGIKPDGTINDIMEERYTATVNTGTDDLHTFDLLGSNCTNDVYKQVASGAASAGTIEVNLPLRYSKYEDVDMMPAWMDQAWGYRKALTIERTWNQTHGAPGHYSDYYGYTVQVPYSANMASTTQDDVRFTGPDGVTELPHYQLNVIDSTSAVYIVMIPWVFLDSRVETIRLNLTGYAYNNPQWLYVYYGNAAATSASDVTLGGYGYFGEDFTTDDGTWSFDGAANTIEGIENGYLKVGSTASQTSTGHAYKNMDHSGSDEDSFEVIWKIIYDTPAYTNTTVSNGPYLRISGRDNTASGGSDESGSYWEVKHFYIAANAGESGANPAGHMWGHAGYDSGVLAYGTNYSNNLNCAVSDTQYIKFRWNKRDTTGTNEAQWFHSDDGVNWNCLGDNAGLTSIFDTRTDLVIHVYYVGKNGVAADKYIRLDAIMAYPTMSHTKQHLWWEESFQNGIFLDRYARLNYLAGARYQTETQDNIEFRNVSGNYIRWDNTNKEALCLYLGGGVTTPAYNSNDVTIFEATITSFSENATAGVVTDLGLCVNDRAGTTSADASLFSLRYTATGNVRTFYRQTFVAGSSDLANAFGTWTQADLPIGLRMVFHSRDRTVYYQVRKYGTGGEWYTEYVSPTAFDRAVTGVYTHPMLFIKGATSNTQIGTFGNWKIYGGGGVMDCNGKVGASTSSWMAEESLADDYPLAVASSDPDSQTIVFTCPTPMKRGNAMKLRTKDFGGDYNYSKTFYLTDQDEIQVGPAGTDQYMGMRLVFDFNMAATDEIEFDTVEFIYEVI